MKKVVLIVTILCEMAFCGIVAYADNTAAYTGGSVNTATITGTSDCSTILITKASDDPITNSSIVYIDQGENIFNATTDFLIKENPSVGLYNVRLRSENGTLTNANFYIGVNSYNRYDTPMTRLPYTASTVEDDSTYYTAGFDLVTSGDAFLDYQSIKVGYMKNNHTYYGGFPLNEHWTPVISGEGRIMLLFVLDHITEDELPSVSVFLSNDPLDSGSAYVGE